MAENTSKPLAVGDRVTFTKMVVHSRNSISFKSLNGVIERFTQHTGKYAVVKYGRSTRTKVPVGELRRDGERSALTEAVVGKKVND